jgi:flagellar hook-associated protein 1 FlgK
MSIGSFLGIETARRGLVAQQRALDTTGHNIANVSTPGYSRQGVALAAGRPLSIAGGGPQGGGMQIGTGVDVVNYQRVRDTFLDLQFRAQAMRLGDASARTRSLDQVELALAEPGDDGIGAQLGRFWSGWSDLANAPEAGAARQSVLDRAGTLAASINALDAHLSGVQAGARTELDVLVADTGDVRAYATELAGLNDSIAAAAARGAQANDLMDRRDTVLDKLSALAQVRVEDVPGRPGALTVFFADVDPAATPLVDGATPADAGAVRAWPLTLPASPGGQLGGLAALADTSSGPVAQYRAELAAVAQTLMTAVNRAYTADGTVAGNFFSAAAGNEAATLAVDPAVTAGNLRAGTGAGSNTTALRMAQLRGRPAPENGADDAYAALVTRIGSEVRAARREEVHAQVLSDAVEDRRQSTSSVSLDEEMTDMIRFQRGYQASARVMSTMDDLLDTLINRTGRVGL